MDKLKVLVAEHDTKVLFAFSKVLENEGCVCIQSDNVSKAIKSIVKNQPNAIFLDVSKPNEDNDKIIKKIAKIKMTMPIIIISSHITDEINKLAADISALQVIEKPLRLESVRHCLDRIKAKLIEK